jgi:hypothetical protein
MYLSGPFQYLLHNNNSSSSDNSNSNSEHKREIGRKKDAWTISM